MHKGDALLAQRHYTVMQFRNERKKTANSCEIVVLQWYRKRMTLPLYNINVKRCFERAHIQIFVWIDAHCKKSDIDWNALYDQNDLQWLDSMCNVQQIKKQQHFISSIYCFIRRRISLLFFVQRCSNFIADCSSGINGCIYHYFNFNFVSFTHFSISFFA